MKDEDIQYEYYKKTAGFYDCCHADAKEHALALMFLSSAIEYLGIKSVLDIGSGTGRVLLYLKKKHPGIILKGIEPVAELREIAYKNGIGRDVLIGGDAGKMDFGGSEFDLVCAFGVLHHVKYPSGIIQEMLRVAGKAIFISDQNNFGMGGGIVRTAKRILKMCGLWKPAIFIKTKGKGYHFDDNDGLHYTYSLFEDYQLIDNCCESTHVLNTKGKGVNPFSTASHIALLGIKK